MVRHILFAVLYNIHSYVLIHHSQNVIEFGINRKDDDSLEPKISADQITLYATVGILGLMLVLFCCCHPEILIVLCRNFKNYLCRRKKRWGNNTVSNAVGEDYVGGVQIEKREDKESERDVI